jgi:hypothetical protein
MKLNITKYFLLLIAATFTLGGIMAQDASINILAGNGGIVATGQTFLLRVDVTNNSATGTVVQNKLRPQISVPASISSTGRMDHYLQLGHGNPHHQYHGSPPCRCYPYRFYHGNGHCGGHRFYHCQPYVCRCGTHWRPWGQ